MADLNPLSLWRRLLALPNESRTKTLAVAFLVSVVCAVLVSSTAVLLKPLQDENRAAERQARMDAMIASIPAMADILAASGADTLETIVVDLDTGAVLDIDPAGAELRDVIANPETSTPLSGEEDVAGLGRRPDHAAIHLLSDGGAVQLVILPVAAVGYQSTIHAYLALEGDLNTVAALAITEQAETPGLGSRIEEPAWLARWPGKQVADESGDIRLQVVRGQASNDYEVDGLTGATVTTNAVTAMIRFWLGENGYGPTLDRLRAGGL